MNEKELFMEVSFDELPAFYKIMVNLVGQENAFKIGQEFGGERIYLPRIDCCIIPVRNRKIAQEYKGSI